jgi:hypothetical protein
VAEAGRSLLVTAGPGVGSAAAEAAALAVAAALDPQIGRALLIDLFDGTAPRPTILASTEAREAAAALNAGPPGELGEPAVARGRICVCSLGPQASVERIELIARGFEGAAIVHGPGSRFGELLEALAPRMVLARIEGRAEAALAGALAIELRRRALPVKIWSRGPGLLQARRALAGIDPGGDTAARARRALALARLEREERAVPRPTSAAPASTLTALRRSESGQALPMMLGLIAVVAVFAAALVAIGGGATAKGRLQRAADLAALSAGRSMRNDLPRLFEPATIDGRANPRHLPRVTYLERATEAAREAAERNGLPPRSLLVSFPDGASFAPLRVRVRARPRIRSAGPAPIAGERRTRVVATAATEPAAAATEALPATTAAGGGYGGPLAHRQGKPMRPDLAAAFDRMARSAASVGVPLVISSGFRSDAEQAALFAANPDPRWVAPPGRSLHRCGTELDLGPAAAYGWLAANAPRFGFLRRYPWEPWHYGYTAGPAPCSGAAEGGGRGPASRGSEDGRSGRAGGLPDYVPAFIRGPLLAAAARHDVSAALLAAQLMAESNFNPAAISPAGARGIAQFMPATAAAYGLDDPFDPAASVDAQARLMADLLSRFGSVALALAAYNAGPGAVTSCSCVPSYPETAAYVARILALLDGAVAGAGGGPVPLEVRLVASRVR